MNDLDRQIAALAESQKQTQESIRALLARDTAKEFNDGKFFQNGQNPSRILKAETFNFVPAANAVPLVFSTQLDVQLIEVNYRYSAVTTIPFVHLKIAYDTNQDFTNVPADGTRRTILAMPDTMDFSVVTPATGTVGAWIAGWNRRFYLPFQFIKLSVMYNTNTLTTSSTWSVAPLSVTFFGK